MADFVIVDKKSVRLSYINSFCVGKSFIGNNKGSVTFWITGRIEKVRLSTPTQLSLIEVSKALDIARDSREAMDFFEAVQKIS